jgi:hypothetical protein
MKSILYILGIAVLSSILTVSLVVGLIIVIKSIILAIVNIL